MKKYLLIVFGVSFLMASIIDDALYKVIRKNLVKKSSSVLTKTVKRTDESYYMKKLLRDTKIKVYKPIDKLAVSATLIAKKGGMVENITKKYPVKMVNYYSKYGDSFLKITNTMLPKIKNIKIPKNLIKKYNITNLNFLSNKEAIAKRFLDVMKWSGKKGYEISKSLLKYANKHKFAVATGIAFAWFLADPQGFNEALNKFGDNIEQFLTSIIKTMGNTMTNTTNNAVDVITSSLSKMINIKNILFLLTIILLIILWKIRGIIRKYIHLKILRKEKKLDNEIEEIKTRSRYE